MTTVREKLERREGEHLAPYAQKVADSAGRVFPERAHPYRTAYQRDRARVIHSRAFRRLEYKTQVFLNGTGDHLRTRLTHTIEVASISRVIACALGANEDLSEVIALAHDLGHAPFGHSGEKELNRLMRDHGGFEHNAQSLRIVQVIESKYPRFPGLNLTHEVLEGLRKHDEGYRRHAFGQHPEECFPQTCLEAQIANLADEITYYSHDIDDGLDHGLISPDQLEELEIWKIASQRVQQDFPALTGDRFLRYVIRHLIDYEVEHLVLESQSRIKDSGVRTADDVRRLPTPLISYSDSIKRANLELRAFLYRHLYHHPDVAGPNRKGCLMVARVFEHYMEHPERLGKLASERLADEGLPRTVCDYVSGMTDRYLAEEFKVIEGSRD